MKKGKFILISLFCLFFPLLVKEVVIEPSGSPQFFIVSAFFILTLIVFLVRRTEILIPDLLLCGLLFAFYFVNLSGFLWSFNLADTIFESQKLFLGIAGLIVFLTYFNSESRHSVLFKSMILIAIFYGAFSLVELRRYEVFNLNKPGVVFSLAGHKNLISSFAFLLIPFSVSGIISYKGIWRIISIIASVIIVCCIAFLQTRSVYLSVGVATFVFCLFYFTAAWKKRKRVYLFSTFFFVGVIVAGFLLKNAVEPTTIKTQTTSSLHERYQLWNNTFQLIEENPLLGVGAGNWQYNYSKFSVEQIESAFFYNTFFKSPHNDFLSVLAETGLVGFAILIFFLILVLRASIVKILEEKNLKLMLVFATLTGLLADSFFSFPKDRIAHILIAALLLSIVIRETGLTYQIRKPKYIFTSFLLVGLVFNILVGYKRISGEYYTLKVLEAQKNLKARDVIENGYKAMSVFYKTDPTCTPIYSYIGWGYYHLGDTDSLLFVNERAYELSPFDYKVLANYGFALERKFQFNTAEKVLLEAYRINPNYESTLLNLSVLAYNRGRYSESMQWLRKIGDYEKKYPVNLQRILEKLQG